MRTAGSLARSGLLAVATVSGVAQAAAPASTVLADIDLSKPFATRSPWQLTAVQGPPIADPFDPGGDQIPGAITLCLRPGVARPCDPQGTGTPPGLKPAGPFSEPHYLRDARIVYPRGPGGRPLLLVVTASLNSGDGDQIRFTQLLAYERNRDRFAPAYSRWTGRNNNQEVRYVDAGPLRGDVISAEPTEDVPFGFWITLDAPTPHGAYARVLRYRSATGYGDGNPLPVIDSEMPSIFRRLGIGRPGALPLPQGSCPKPHLVQMELWCD